MTNSITRITFIFLSAGLAAFFCYFPITDTDIFWHLAAGREILATGHLLFTDPFSFTLAHPQWIDLHWLFQLLTCCLYCLGGFNLLIIFKVLIVAASVAILCSIFSSRSYAIIAAIASAILFYQTRYLILLRPTLITMFCMTLYILLFENAKKRNSYVILWFCIPLQIFWTNSQGLYPLGLFITGCYWAEAVLESIQQKKKLPVHFSFIFIACCLSCFINPYGTNGLLLPLSLMARITPDIKNIYSQNIAENVPLFSLTGFEAGYRYLVIIVSVAIAVVFISNRKNHRTSHILLFLGFLCLAYSAVRNVLLFSVIAIPILSYHASGLFSRLQETSKGNQCARGLLGGCGILCFLFIIEAIIQHGMTITFYPSHHALSPFRFPEQIVAHLKRNPLAGNMFNDVRSGGYLIWYFYPDKQVFIDGRLVIRSPEFFTEYLAICYHPELFSRVAEKFNITHVILPSAIFNLYHGLIIWLYHSKEWHIEYTDGSFFLFVRNTERQNPIVDLNEANTVDSIYKAIGKNWKDAPYVKKEAEGYFGDILNSIRCSTGILRKN
jgi:hypothetical protein